MSDVFFDVIVFKVIDNFTSIKIASPRSSEPGYTTRHYCWCFGWLLAVAKFQDCENLVFVFARHDRRLIVVLTPRITYTRSSLVTASLHHKSIVFVIISILRLTVVIPQYNSSWD